MFLIKFLNRIYVGKQAIRYFFFMKCLHPVYYQKQVHAWNYKFTLQNYEFVVLFIFLLFYQRRQFLESFAWSKIILVNTVICFCYFFIFCCYFLLFYETSEAISGKVLLDQKEFLLIKPSPGAPPLVWITNILIRKRVNGGKGRSGATKGRLQKEEGLNTENIKNFRTIFSSKRELYILKRKA